MQSWIYFGPHNDPHLRAFVPGMSWLTEHVVTPEVIAATVPGAETPPWVARITRIPNLADGVTALALREAWKTQISPEPVYSLFLHRHAGIDPAELLKGAQAAFPEVWKRFRPITIGETCTRELSSPKPLAASVSTTSTAEPALPPEKPSAKSSA